MKTSGTSRGGMSPFVITIWSSRAGMIRRILRPITADSSINTETHSREDTPITCEVDGFLLSVRVLESSARDNETHPLGPPRNAPENLSILATKAEAKRVSLRKRQQMRTKALRRGGAPRFNYALAGRTRRSVRIDCGNALWPRRLLAFRGSSERGH